jgi:hypothetical protein
VAAGIDRDHPEPRAEMGGEQIESTSVVEHAVQKHHRRRLRITPLAQPEADAE